MPSPLSIGPKGLLRNGNLGIINPNQIAVPNGLIGYWGFDPDCLTTTRATDLSGQNNHMVLGNSPMSVGGQIGTGLKLNGTNNYGTVTPPLSGLLSGLTATTLCFWMNKASFNNSHSMAFEYSISVSTNNGAFMVDPDSGAPASGLFQVALSGSGTPGAIAFTRPSTGVWHHYVVIFNLSQAWPTTISVYVDMSSQSLTNSTTITNPPTSFGNYTLYMGARAASLFFISANLDDVRIYNRALSPAEIQLIYNAGLNGRRDAGTNVPMVYSL